MYNIRRGSFFTMSNKGKDRNQNIKVFARVRPRNSQELRSNVVVECTSNKDISVKDKGQIKTFAFDRVFGPESKQVDVYKAVVAPMISEVLQGYNCTVFAYGQTGTGKTFTMVGDRSKDKCGGWENDPLSGIVPRTLDHLFDELKVKAEDYTVRVSFLELYNEELCDLLAPVDNDDTKTLRLFEDAMKKGSVIVAGLEERTVYEKNDVYPILEAGSLRRQTAPTLMNASSSRSHTIFMITVHVKVTTPEGEDLFKTGKLNLVDLAGSENIGRSGAVDMRAREAGNINQSLLTLGRVITSLVERTPHVPYRESKLTRILQDSLGGRTKTSIIATLSPALCNLEETLSTCDYAHRARNITNKPEINQKTSKHVLLKNYTDEIERLRRDLMATREKHGVYLQSEDYNGMLTQIESLNKDLVNKIQLLKVREDELAKQEDIMQSLNMNLYETKSNLDKNLEILQVKEEALKEREIALRELNDQAQLLLRTADEATEDSKKLHDRLDRARMIHNQNEELVEKFKSRFVQNLVTMKGSTQAFQKRSADLVKILTDISETRTKACQNHEQDVGSVLNGFLLSIENLLPKLSSQIIDQIDQSKPTFEENVSLVSTVGESLNAISDFVKSKTDSWSETRHPVWGNLSSKIGESRENQIKLGEDLKVVETCVKAGSAEILDLPSSVLASATEEEEYQRELQERDKIVDELDALRERERVLAVALRNCNVALEEKRQRIENNRRQAAESAASAVTHKLCGLLELLTAMSNINNNLTGSGEGILGDVEKLRDDEVKDQKQLQTLLLDKLNKANETVIEICEKQRNEISVVESVVDEGRVAQSEMTSVVATFQQCIEDMTSEEEKRLNDHEVAAKAAHRQLANEVSDFCDQTFANIHDRCTELKVNLKEEFLKDEKTGTTPQRKEFQYPKRLVTTGKFIEGQENIPPVDITKRSSLETSRLSGRD